MANKTLTLLSLSVLALLAIVAFASAEALATWNLTTNAQASGVDTTQLTAGDLTIGAGATLVGYNTTTGIGATSWDTADVDATAYYQVTLSALTGYNFVVDSISFEHLSDNATSAMHFTVNASTDGFATSTQILAETATDNSAINTATISDLNKLLTEGKTLTLRIYGYDGVALEKFSVKNLKVEGSEVPSEIAKCSLGTAGNLKLTFDDVTVTGYGEDFSDLYPLDKVLVDVNVDSNSAYRIKNIGLKWGLYDKTKGEFIIDGDESDFTLKDGDEKTVEISFTLDKPRDFKDGGDYVFYVWTDGAQEQTDKDVDTFIPVCASQSEQVTVVISSNFVMLSNLQTSETVSCGSTIQVTGKAWNLGEEDEAGVYLKVYNQALGINSKVELGDIDKFKSKDLIIDVAVPKSAELGKAYNLEFSVYNENDELFQNENDDEAKFVLAITPTSGCKNEPQASISASLESVAEAGKELVVKATIKNDGTETKTFTFSADNFADWASSAALDKESAQIEAGKSADVLITMNVNSDVEGSQTFDFVVTEGTKVLSQPVKVEVAKPVWSFTGAFLGTNKNAYIWGIVALNVILVFVIILVAVKVMKK